MTEPPSKVEDVLLGMEGSSNARLASLRALKSRIIGCKRAKLAFINHGAVQRVLDILASETDFAVAVQAAQALGSFAAHAEGARAVIQHGGVSLLLQSLDKPDARLVEAAIRALRLLFKSGLVTQEDTKRACGAITHFVALLSVLEPPVLAESAGIVLSHCCTVQEGRTLIVKANAIEPVVNLLGLPPKSRQGAALECLAALTSADSGAASQVLKHASVVPQLLAIAKQTFVQPRLKFLACATIVSLLPHMQTSGTETQHHQQRPQDGALSPLKDENVASMVLTKADVESAVLPVLVRLLDCFPNTAADAAAVLTSLVRDQPQLQTSAVDADAIAKLAVLVRDTSFSEHGRASALEALAVLCADHEVHRQQLLEAGVLQPVVAALSEGSSAAVRSAACCCLRSLSRSTALLRKAVGTPLREVVAPLLDLSKKSMTPDSASDAAATLANLAVDYCTVKEELMRLNGLSHFVMLAGSDSKSVRLHGIWGLSSMAFLASVATKESVLMEYSWESVDSLLRDADANIRQKTLLLLRNLMHSPRPKRESLQRWTSNALLPSLLRCLQDTNASPREHQHALYTVVNIASGRQPYKDDIMAENGLPDAITAALSHGDDSVREAAVWAVINLCCLDEDIPPELRQRCQHSVANRINAFRTLGAEAKLLNLHATDACIAVRERADVALLQFRAQYLHRPHLSSVEMLASHQSRHTSARSAWLRRHREATISRGAAYEHALHVDARPSTRSGPEPPEMEWIGDDEDEDDIPGTTSDDEEAGGGMGPPRLLDQTADARRNLVSAARYDELFRQDVMSRYPEWARNSLEWRRHRSVPPATGDGPGGSEPGGTTTATGAPPAPGVDQSSSVPRRTLDAARAVLGMGGIDDMFMEAGGRYFSDDDGVPGFMLPGGDFLEGRDGEDEDAEEESEDE